MKTFSEVADKYSLLSFRKELYDSYMKERWPEEESRMSQDGYAAEWAQRFLDGQEYQASDLMGQRILDRLNNRH